MAKTQITKVKEGFITWNW